MDTKEGRGPVRRYDRVLADWIQPDTGFLTATREHIRCHEFAADVTELVRAARAIFQYEKDGAPAYCDWDKNYERLRTALVRWPEGGE